MKQGESSIGRGISILHRHGQCFMSKKLEHLHIGKGQPVILLNLHRNGGINQEHLADFLKIDKGSIAKSIKKLEDEGYVERKVDSEDKRAYKVFLTQKGQDVIPTVQGAIQSWEEHIVSELSENERQLMEQLLSKMVSRACSRKQVIGENEK